MGMRTSDGTVTSLDASLADTRASLETIPESINQFGLITGWYLDAAAVVHGFVWTPKLSAEVQRQWCYELRRSTLPERVRRKRRVN